VVALDFAADEVVSTRATFGGMIDAGRDHPRIATSGCCAATPPACRSATAFDRVITSEVLEHIQDDVAAIAELVRVLKPGRHAGRHGAHLVPEKINWMLSDEYHAAAAGGRACAHLLATELKAKLRAAGLG
jgi:SAM-dependent methyltransferase